MATVKVFDANGFKELQCFDTLDRVDYIPPLSLTEEQKVLIEMWANSETDEEIE